MSLNRAEQNWPDDCSSTVACACCHRDTTGGLESSCDIGGLVVYCEACTALLMVIARGGRWCNPVIEIPNPKTIGGPLAGTD